MEMVEKKDKAKRERESSEIFRAASWLEIYQPKSPQDKRKEREKAKREEISCIYPLYWTFLILLSLSYPIRKKFQSQCCTNRISDWRQQTTVSSLGWRRYKRENTRNQRITIAWIINFQKWWGVAGWEVEVLGGLRDCWLKQTSKHHWLDKSRGSIDMAEGTIKEEKDPLSRTFCSYKPTLHWLTHGCVITRQTQSSVHC